MDFFSIKKDTILVMAFVLSLAPLFLNAQLMITVALALLVLLDITFIMVLVLSIVLLSVNALPKTLNVNVPVV